MNLKRLILIAPSIGLVLLTTACQPPVFPWLTKGVAPWWYVNDYWGGLAFNRMEAVGGKTTLYFNLKVHEVKQGPDGFFVYGGSYKIQGDKILISVYRWIELSDLPTSLPISIPNLVPGHYNLVYNDKLSGYPQLGSVEIK